MVYRDNRDPRIAQLKELLATEPDLLEHRGLLRRQHDTLQERADELGRELAEIERGGVIATISGWLGKSPSRVELDEISAKLAQLVAEERGVDASLAGLDRARAELAELEAVRAATLRTMPGAIGDELRALDTELARQATVIEAIRTVMIEGDRVETVVISLNEAKAEQRWTAITAQAVADQLRTYVRTFDTVRERYQLWPDEQRVDLPRTQLARFTDLDAITRNADSIATSTGRLQGRLANELRARQRRHAEVVKRQRELLDQTT